MDKKQEDSAEGRLVQTAVLPKLVRQQLALGRPVWLRVTSGSMRPLLRRGDVVRVERCDPTVLAIHDVVTVATEAGLLTHRVVAIDAARDTLTLRGDRMGRADAPVGFDVVVGRVVGVWRYGRLWSLDVGVGWWWNRVCLGLWGRRQTVI